MIVATGSTQVTTMIDILTQMVTAFAGYVTTWVSTIFASGNDLLVASIVLPLVGVGLGFLLRITRGKAGL